MKYLFVLVLLLAILPAASAELNAAIEANQTCHLGLPLPVQFEGVCSEQNITNLWEFGDGNTSDEQSPLYTYTTYDAFTITHTCTPDIGEPVMDIDYITVAPVGDVTCNGDIPDGNTTIITTGDTSPAPYIVIGSGVGFLVGALLLREGEMK